MVEETILELLVQEIVDEVIRRIKNQPKKALVVFTGGTIGFAPAIEAIEKLKKQDKWEIQVALSEAAEEVLSPDKIREVLKVDKIYTSKSTTPQKELYGNADMIIMPVVTINTAAKLATGICDTYVTSLANHAIMAGVPVVGATNACDPDDSVREKIGMGNSPEAYRQMLKGNIEKLRSFGIDMLPAEEMYQYLSGRENDETADLVKAVKEQLEPQENKTNNTPKSGKSGITHTDKRVISRGDVMYCAMNSIPLVVSERAIITEYAKEAMKEFNVTLKKV